MLIIFIYNLFKRGDKCCSWLVFKLAKVGRAFCRSRLRQRIFFWLKKLQNWHTKITAIGLAVLAKTSLNWIVGKFSRKHAASWTHVWISGEKPIWLTAFINWIHAVKVSLVKPDCPDAFHCLNISAARCKNVRKKLADSSAFTVGGSHISLFFLDPKTKNWNII